MTTITMSSQEISDQDVQAVVDVLRSGRLALGPQTEAFEHDLAAYLGVKHAAAVNSGTSALHLIVRALGLGQGDEVLVPSFTFAASVNALLFEGATPVFVDIEPETYNLDPADLARKVTPRTKAIMAVDIFGHPAEWDGITDRGATPRLCALSTTRARRWAPSTAAASSAPSATPRPSPSTPTNR